MPLRSARLTVGHFRGGSAFLRNLINVVLKHGNRLDPDKRVLVKFDGVGSNLTIVVGDEGRGFDPERVSDPLAPENQMKTSGRGIFYIRTFMDDVAFSQGETGGTVLTMRKDLNKRGNAKGENA